MTTFTADTTPDEILRAPVDRLTAVLHAAEAARIVRSVHPRASLIEFAHAEYDQFPTGVLFMVWSATDDDEPLFDYNVDPDGGSFSDDQLDLIEALLTWAAEADVSELFTEAAEPDGVAWALDLDKVLHLDRLISVGRLLHHALGTTGIGEVSLDDELESLVIEVAARQDDDAEPSYDDTRWSRLAYLLDLMGERDLCAELTSGAAQ